MEKKPMYAISIKIKSACQNKINIEYHKKSKPESCSQTVNQENQKMAIL